MEGYGKVGPDLTKKMTRLGLAIDEHSEGILQNNIDRAIFQTLHDSELENDEPLRVLEKPLFDSKKSVERLDVEDSIILKLAYGTKS